jgi:hypothetical protein
MSDFSDRGRIVLGTRAGVRVPVRSQAQAAGMPRGVSLLLDRHVAVIRVVAWFQGWVFARWGSRCRRVG